MLFGGYVNILQQITDILLQMTLFMERSCEETKESPCYLTSIACFRFFVCLKSPFVVVGIRIRPDFDRPRKEGKNNKKRGWRSERMKERASDDYAETKVVNTIPVVVSVWLEEQNM
jgi:hypothetical protein